MSVRKRGAGGLVALIAFACAVLAGVGPASSEAKPNRCTITGTSSTDILSGTKRRDVICGRGGRDRIVAARGRDLVRGGEGMDRLKGRDGDDILQGGAGDDTIYGEGDDDVLEGGLGADILDPGEGDNDCPGYDETDLVHTTCWAAFEVESLRITPSSVDTWLADREVQVTVDLTDTSEDGEDYVTVLDSVGVDTHSPIATAPGRPPGGEFRLQLISGDAETGTWSGPVALRRYSPSGTFAISLVISETIVVTDTGASLPLYWRLSPPMLRRAGHPHTIDQVGPGDSRPNVRGLEFAPRVVAYPGFTNTPQTRLSVEVSAPVSPVDDVRAEVDGEPVLMGPAHHQYSDTFISTWEGSVFLHPNASAGMHGVSEISVTKGSTTRTYDASQLEDMGFDPNFHYEGPPSAASQE
ncbi:MAG: calcium-binding protein [Solirubrobacterales bacterium]